MASGAGVVLAPIASTLRSLCSRDSRAAVMSPIAAALTPATLFAVMAMPMPLPHTRTPRSKRAFADAARHGRGKVWIVHRVGPVGAEVLVRDTQFVQCGLQRVLQFDAGMIGAQSHSHRADYRG